MLEEQFLVSELAGGEFGHGSEDSDLLLAGLGRVGDGVHVVEDGLFGDALQLFFVVLGELVRELGFQILGGSEDKFPRESGVGCQVSVLIGQTQFSKTNGLDVVGGGGEFLRKEGEGDSTGSWDVVAEVLVEEVP